MAQAAKAHATPNPKIFDPSMRGDIFGKWLRKSEGPFVHALYIHWPFCLAKCPYCDFNSHVRAATDMATWQRALLADLRHERCSDTSEERLTSVFFGGGTPSLMPPSLVAAILAEAEKLWGFDANIEITLEANPSSVEAANFAELATVGVNRVSLGVQSLHDETLRFLGRLHSAEEALRAIDIAQRNFDRVSFDLIYARPDQTIAEWKAELSAALAMGTGHLSLYQLTIEPGTRFATEVRRGTMTPLDDDAAADLFALTQDMTRAAGLPAYEISNHARPGEESRHNLTYWRYRDYIGIGPGAHGRRGGVATLRHRKPENFLSAVAAQGHGIVETRTLGSREQASEALLMGLRLGEGVDLEDLGERFGIAPVDLLDERKVSFQQANGLVWRHGSRVGVTPAGMPLLDAVLADIVDGELVA